MTILNDVASPLQIQELMIDDSAEGIEITEVGLNDLAKPILLAQFQFILKSPSGVVNGFSHLVNRVDNPSSLAKAHKFCAVRAKSPGGGLAQVQVQLGYVLFADGTRWGVSKEEAHSTALTYISPKRKAYGELANFLASSPKSDAEAFLRSKPQLSSFVNIYSKEGRAGVEAELRRLQSILLAAGL